MKYCKNCDPDGNPSDECKIEGHKMIEKPLSEKIRELMGDVNDLFKEGEISERGMKIIKCGLGQLGIVHYKKVEKLKEALGKLPDRKLTWYDPDLDRDVEGYQSEAIERQINETFGDIE